MKLVVGLGNPGKQYQKTRHNVGFRVLDALENKLKAEDQRLKAILLKPQTFMNLSGQEVAKKANFYKIKSEDMAVIYDELDLPFSEIRVRKSGSSAGHKGVESIINSLGTENFTRIRIGIGRPPENFRTEDYVLENFTKEEEPVIQKAVDEAVEIVIKWLGKE